MKSKGFTPLMTNNRIVPSAGYQPPSTTEVIQHILQSGRRHALLDGMRPGMKTKPAVAAWVLLRVFARFIVVESWDWSSTSLVLA
jgi:hypothetical protein